MNNENYGKEQGASCSMAGNKFSNPEPATSYKQLKKKKEKDYSLLYIGTIIT